MSDDQLDQSLVASISAEDLKKPLAVLAEVGLDQVIDEGILRDVPVVGVLVQLYKIPGTVRDRIFAQKVCRFLLHLGEVPVAERQGFIAQFGTVEERRRLGETLGSTSRSS